MFLRLNPRHLAIDEAQLLPERFPSLRVAIDAHRGETGRFVITGSSSPPAEPIDGLTPRGDIVQVQDFWFRGGFPEPWLKSDSALRTRWVAQLIKTNIRHSASRGYRHHQ